MSVCTCEHTCVYKVPIASQQAEKRMSRPYDPSLFIDSSTPEACECICEILHSQCFVYIWMKKSTVCVDFAVK